MPPKRHSAPSRFVTAYNKLADFDVVSLFKRAPPPGTPRTVFIGQSLPDESYNFSKKGKKTIKPENTYVTNQVVTSKYTIFTFLPRNLLEQFRRLANVFFLFIAILQFFPKFATISPGLVIFPLLVVLGITAIKDSYEDAKRHQSDHRVNYSETLTLVGGGIQNPNVMGPKQKTFTPGIPKALRRRSKGLLDQAEEKSGEEDLHPGAGVPPSRRGTFTSVTSPFTSSRDSDPNVPADVVICATSEPEHIAFVETKNLDGETNLKSRRAVEELFHLASPQAIVESISKDPFRIEAEAPDVNMYKLNAAVVWSDGRRCPIDLQTVLLRGTVLRNTEWVIGIVLYTGTDTKVVMNSGVTPSKRSRVERQMNPMVFINLVMLATMGVVCAIVDSVLEHRYVDRGAYWLYLDHRSTDNPSINGLVTLANAFITFQNVVPISLYISIEFVRTCQAAFIYFDSEMYYVKPGQSEDEGQPTLARTWNLSDDLGQIEYIFSDKTGTLTQNSMEFRQCSIGGKIYKGQAPPVAPTPSPSSSEKRLAAKGGSNRGSPPGGAQSLTSDAPTLADPSSTIAPQVKPGGMLVPPAINDNVNLTPVKLAEGVLSHFYDPELLNDLRTTDRNERINGFFTTLGLCHTVLTSADPGTRAISYKAQSPDEAALVQAAADVGFVFLGREPSSAIVRLQTPSSPKPHRYETLSLLDFTSTRKRMSVILKKIEDGAGTGEGVGTILLLCKGADQVIFERLGPNQEEMKERTGQDLDTFANEGLRTLCLSYRVVSPEEYEEWDHQYREAQVQLENRDAHVERVANEIERDLILLGATAIEDKLQEGVPETIADLKRAGIRVWVATGDKLETAVAIGNSTNLISHESNLIVVKGSETPGKTAYNQMVSSFERFFPNSGVLDKPNVRPTSESDELAPVTSRRNFNRINTGLSDVIARDNGERPGGFVLVIDGVALEQIFAEEFSKDLLLELALRCEAVICCRVSPLQKALVVRLVKDGLHVMTLAIGDGANDVSMIQAADVGVGISGEEGLQAVNASDYAIAQFRFLKRLLFVHGQWSYARNANMIVNFFYKNIMGIGVLWWFQIYCAWSTTYVFEYTYLLFWNVFWSLAPVIAIGIFDRNIDSDILMAIPELYRYGRERVWFGTGIFLAYMLDGAYQSAVVFFLLLYAYKTTTARGDGYDVYMYEFSTTMVISAVMVVNAFHVLCTSAWTAWVIFAVTIGVVLILVYTAIYSIIPPKTFYTPIYGNDHYLFRSAYFYFGIILTFFIAMAPRYCWRAYRMLYYPNDIDIMRVVRRDHPDLDLASHPLIGQRWAEDGTLRPLDAGDPESQSNVIRLPNRPASQASFRGPAGQRTDMSTGLEMSPSRGFDFSQEEGGIAIRRIQTGLSERNGQIGGPPITPKRRFGERFIPSSIRKSSRRGSSRPPISGVMPS
ncbi:uncharacterized protein EI90DRAFT_3158823 [Cantharellus anzutake]|uniref:uncharacterized protein n=1 Tax=Cantharellus anzutake TaxID=1750568 RepID=UPI0019040996|nr:uncharacterized protein EI90DRAFT_3158823 [Cantharellus anzutake]KAF8316939.1 hypothetical protein EI90DRAFT_3158823 [Cantharellus anzutake]